MVNTTTETGSRYPILEVNRFRIFAGLGSGHRGQCFAFSALTLSGARCRLAYGPADAIATDCLLLQ